MYFIIAISALPPSPSSQKNNKMKKERKIKMQ
jgi:hypothetical protein